MAAQHRQGPGRVCVRGVAGVPAGLDAEHNEYMAISVANIMMGRPLANSRRPARAASASGACAAAVVGSMPVRSASCRAAAHACTAQPAAAAEIRPDVQWQLLHCWLLPLQQYEQDLGTRSRRVLCMDALHSLNGVTTQLQAHQHQAHQHQAHQQQAHQLQTGTKQHPQLPYTCTDRHAARMRAHTNTPCSHAAAFSHHTTRQDDEFVMGLSCTRARVSQEVQHRTLGSSACMCTVNSRAPQRICSSCVQVQHRRTQQNAAAAAAQQAAVGLRIKHVALMHSMESSHKPD